MEHRVSLDIAPQPDATTCGPTCLHAVYRYFDDELPLATVVEQTHALTDGGTLGVFLGCHALRRGYRATIYTYDLQLFDPTWFGTSDIPLADRLTAQMQVKEGRKLKTASRAFLEFLSLGGRVRMEDMTGALLRRYLKRKTPILTGLSATYLYGEPRECGQSGRADDVRGVPQGHFVILCGYAPETRSVLIADPLHPNPLGQQQQQYTIDLDRVMCAIMLGTVTYDANLLVIEPAARRGKPRHGQDAH
ncbi:MAG: hypothetical protein ACF8PG_18580 [Maioricimonas sp. JB045]